MKTRLLTYLSVGVMLLSCLAKAETCDLDIRHQKLESQKDALIFSLLQLSLSKTERQACYSALDDPITAARKSREIKMGRLDVKWASVSPEAEAQLRAIRIPIFKGLIGYRIFVIRDGDQGRFANIKTVDDLRGFRAGVGERWGDKAVLEVAGLPTVVSPRGRYLWNMLVGSRFDYLALGVHEPWQNLPRFGSKLAVESNLMLVYPMAFYFYVSKNDEELYQAIRQGMEAAIADGSYDRLLFRSAMMRETVAKANVSGRHIIFLDNPNVPKDTPLHRPELWLNPQALAEQVRLANKD